MPVKRRVSKARAIVDAEPPTDLEWSFLVDDPLPKPEPGAEAWRWRCLSLASDSLLPARGRTLRELWSDYGPEVMADWPMQHPGTRPSCWWRWDAPEPRRQVAGFGWKPYPSNLRMGIPTGWITWGVDLRPLDLSVDPPRFESQPAYLLRLGLLQPGERERLGPADFAPETVKVLHRPAVLRGSNELQHR